MLSIYSSENDAAAPFRLAARPLRLSTILPGGFDELQFEADALDGIDYFRRVASYRGVTLLWEGRIEQISRTLPGPAGSGRASIAPRVPGAPFSGTGRFIITARGWGVGAVRDQAVNRWWIDGETTRWLDEEKDSSNLGMFIATKREGGRTPYIYPLQTSGTVQFVSGQSFSFRYLPAFGGTARRLTCSYTLALSSGSWRADGYAVIGGVTTNIFNITVAGSGTIDIDLPSPGASNMVVRMVSLAAQAFTGAPGSVYVSFSNTSVYTEPAAQPVTTDYIIKQIAPAVPGLSSDYAGVQATGFVPAHAFYQDNDTPADIFNQLALVGDGATPYRSWDWAVWEGRKLAFAPRVPAATAAEADYLVTRSACRGDLSVTLGNPLMAAQRFATRATVRWKDQKGLPQASTYTVPAPLYAITRDVAADIGVSDSTRAAAYAQALATRAHVLRSAAPVTIVGPVLAANGSAIDRAQLRAGKRLVITDVMLPGQDMVSPQSSVDGQRTLFILKTEYHAPNDAVTIWGWTRVPSNEY